MKYKQNDSCTISLILKIKIQRFDLSMQVSLYMNIYIDTKHSQLSENGNTYYKICEM